MTSYDDLIMQGRVAVDKLIGAMGEGENESRYAAIALYAWQNNLISRLAYAEGQVEGLRGVIKAVAEGAEAKP